MIRPLAIVGLVTLAGMTSRAADEPETSPTEVVQSIIEEMKLAETSFKADYEAAWRGGKSEEEQIAIQEKYEEQLAEATQFLMKIAREFPWHPATVEAIVWALTEGEGAGVDVAEAFELLTKAHMSLSLQRVNHLSDERIAELCIALMHRYPFGYIAAFYRTVLVKTENRRVRAYAVYALASRSRRAARDIRDYFETSSDERREKGAIHYSEAEAVRLEAEADALFQQLVDEYADITLGSDTLGEVAAANLAAGKMVIGRSVPEIEGVDAEGKRFKLSDYRGKIVVLSFWAGWCKPCMELVPEERSLVKRMEGKPFVLLGVNSDETMEEFREVQESKQVTWRSWWDGPNDLISTRWNLRYWPSIYVIDRQGVMRSERLSFNDVREGKLDELIERLLVEE